MALDVGGYRQINKALNICAFEDYLKGQQSSLPKLQDVEQISPRVVRVLRPNSGKFTLQGTNTYIVGTGSQRLIIDTGQSIPDWAPLISSTLTTSKASLSYIFLTHWHGDHTGGVPDLLRMCPDLSTSIYKHIPSKTQQPITDGQRFQVEGATIRAVHTPGHSEDHMCFMLEEEQAMFTEDAVLGQGTAAVEQLRIWMESLHKIQSHNCIRDYPAHGSVVEDLRAKISTELAQKVRRERQVLQKLKETRGKERVGEGRGKGSMTVKELVIAMHGAQVGQGVRELTIEPFMEEVLRKLAEDGRVGFEMRVGIKKWFAIGV